MMTAAKLDDFLLRLGRLNIKVDSESADHILTNVHRLAVAYRLTSYDAAYLELALRRNLPLATLDNELVAACKASGVVLL
jgi:predicted nucleic acid-binding protein